RAAALYDRGEPCGAEANSAKFLGARAGYEACLQAVLTHGGFGYAKEYHVERLLREVLITRIAPTHEQLSPSFSPAEVSYASPSRTGIASQAGTAPTPWCRPRSTPSAASTRSSTTPAICAMSCSTRWRKRISTPSSACISKALSMSVAPPRRISGCRDPVPT